MALKINNFIESFQWGVLWVCFYLLSRTCDANFTPKTYSLHSVSRSLHLAHPSNINPTTSGYSLSSLPIHTYIYIYISLSLLTYPTHCLAHEPPPPSLLTDSQHAAGKRASLPESHLQLLPETERKRARPPRPMSSTFQFYPLLVWLRCQLRPVTLLFARCYPIASSCTPSLCPGLP